MGNRPLMQILRDAVNEHAETGVITLSSDEWRNVQSILVIGMTIAHRAEFGRDGDVMVLAEDVERLKKACL